MVSQSSILFLLAFSAVAVSARPLDRRAPDAMGEATNQAAPADQIQASREKLNKALACVDDKMKTPKIPLATAGEPGQSPLLFVDALQECLEMHYSKSSEAQAGPDGQTSGGQTGTDVPPPPGGQAGTDAPPPPPGGQAGNDAPPPPPGGQAGNDAPPPPPGGQAGNDAPPPPPGGQTFAEGAK